MTYRSVLGFGQEKVEDNGLYRTPNNKNKVRVPADRLQGDRPGELVEQAASIDSQRGKGHTLSAHLEGQDLDRVESLQGRQADRVNGAEDEDERNGGLGSSGVGLIRLGKDARSGAHADPHHAATGHAEQHQGPAANTVDKSSTSQGEHKLKARIAEEDVSLGNRLRVTGRSQNGGQEIGQGAIASPLGEEGEDAVACKAVAAGAGMEEGTVVPPAFILYEISEGLYVVALQEI
jgi:hypothetical protein